MKLVYPTLEKTMDMVTGLNTIAKKLKIILTNQQLISVWIQTMRCLPYAYMPSYLVQMVDLLWILKEQSGRLLQ